MKKIINEIADIVESIELLDTTKIEKEAELIEALKKYREEQSITGRKLAMKLDISPAYLCDIEFGRRRISKNMLSKLFDL